MDKRKVLAISFTVALLGLLVWVNWPFVIPLLVAAIFALGTRDLLKRIAQKAEMSYQLTVYLSLVVGLLLFWIPLAIATYRVFVYFNSLKDVPTSDVYSRVQNLQNWVLEKISSLSEFLSIDLLTPAKQLFEKVVGAGGKLLLQLTSEFFQHLPNIFLGSMVFVFALAFFLLKAEFIYDLFKRPSWMPLEQLDRITKAIKLSCSTTLFSTIIIGLIQAFIIGVASLLFDQGDFWLVLIVTFFVSFIPVIGAAPLGYILTIMAFIEGSYGAALGLGVFSTAAGLIDNILKPFMVGSLVKAPAILAFTSVVGAIMIMGISGLLFGPIIMNMTLLIVPILSEEA